MLSKKIKDWMSPAQVTHSSVQGSIMLPSFIASVPKAWISGQDEGLWMQIVRMNQFTKIKLLGWKARWQFPNLQRARWQFPNQHQQCKGIAEELEEQPAPFMGSVWHWVLDLGFGSLPEKQDGGSSHFLFRALGRDFLMIQKEILLMVSRLSNSLCTEWR